MTGSTLELKRRLVSRDRALVSKHFLRLIVVNSSKQTCQVIVALLYIVIFFDPRRNVLSKWQQPYFAFRRTPKAIFFSGFTRPNSRFSTYFRGLVAAHTSTDSLHFKPNSQPSHAGGTKLPDPHEPCGSLLLLSSRLRSRLGL